VAKIFLCLEYQRRHDGGLGAIWNLEAKHKIIFRLYKIKFDRDSDLLTEHVVVAAGVFDVLRLDRGRSPDSISLLLLDRSKIVARFAGSRVVFPRRNLLGFRFGWSLLLLRLFYFLFLRFFYLFLLRLLYLLFLRFIYLFFLRLFLLWLLRT